MLLRFLSSLGHPPPKKKKKNKGSCFGRTTSDLDILDWTETFRVKEDVRDRQRWRERQRKAKLIKDHLTPCMSWICF